MKHLLFTIFALPTLALTACAQAQPAEPPPHPLAGKPIALPQPTAPGQVDLPRFPSISPDGKTLCFSWRGDLWAVPATGGQASRLTAHPMNDSLSAWSPDGKTIAFNSDRSGYRNVYRMNADGTAVSPITREDRPLFLAGWAGNESLAVSAFLEADAHKNPRPYYVGSTGGPIVRAHDAFGRSPALSPNGQYLAFVRGRASWSKPFLTNSDNRDLWLYDRLEKSFRRLTDNPGNDGKPKWIDNETLAYLSARPPQRVNLYRLKIDQNEAQAEQLTAFTDNDIQHFDVAQDTKTAVLHVWDKLYTLDLEDNAANPSPIMITAATDASDTTLVQSLAGQTNQAALSPDGNVMAMSIRGELFIKTLDSKNPPQRITRHPALDHQPTWSPDGQTLYFTSDRDGTLSIYQAKVTLTRSEIESTLSEVSDNLNPDQAEDIPEASPLRGETNPDQVTEDAEAADSADEETATPNPADRWHDAIRFTIEPVIQTEYHDTDASPSPDGKTLAFRRGNGKLILHDLESGAERVYLDQWDDGLHWAWSGDSRYLAVSYEDQDHNADIWVAPADGSAPPINVTKHPAMDRLPSFSLDNKVLTFVSSRSDDQYDVYAVYLDQALESFTPQQLAEYYEEAGNAVQQLKPLGSESQKEADDESNEPNKQAEHKAKEEKPLDLDDAYLRLRRLTSTPESEWDAVLLPGGERVVFSRGDAVYTIGWDGKDEKKVADNVDFQGLSLTGDALAGVSRGTATKQPIGGGEAAEAAVTGSIRVDRRAMQKQRFTEASRALTMAFYDGTFKGIDWPGATAKYAQLAERTWTPDEFDDVANRYLGLLSASHMGIRSPRLEATNSEPNGRLGAFYERVDTGYRVTAIEPNTPAAKGPMRLQVGDIITAIDFEPITAFDTIPSRLVGRVGQETVVTVRRSEAEQDEARELQLLLTPISYRAFDDLRYENWRLSNKARVLELSDGRLGYIHIEAMNAASLAEFERDLYAACEGKEGLIIDVRDNGGGWTTDRLLASIMTERHAYTVPRGADPERTNSYPITRLFIPRYNLPMNALCNENSFSNAEIFSHAFKTLERGTLVGNTTAGGVISTGGARLLDGTTVRLPFRGWYLPDGTDMENNGAVPHLLIPQTPEDESAGRDRQLEAAVKDLLSRLGPA